MKKSFLLTLIGIITFTILILVSCNRKDVTSINIADNSTKDMLVKYLIQQKTIDASASSFIDTLINKSDWNNIIKTAISDKVQIIYLPLYYNSNNTGVIFHYNNLTQKIFNCNITETPINNSTSISHSTATNINRPIDVIKGFYSYKMNGYTGYIRTYSLSNNFLWEFGYENGSKRYEKLISSSEDAHPSSGSTQIKSNSIGTSTVKANGCLDWYTVTWYDDGTSDWHFIGTTCDGNCLESIGITQDSLRIKSNCNGTGSGTGGTNLNYKIITNSITDPCLKNLINKLIGSNNLNNNIGNLLVSTFGKNDIVNITFIENDKLADLGSTTAILNSNGTLDFNNINVQLNALKLKNYSQESQTLTIMHEVLHAYLIQTYQTQADQSLTGHTKLIKSYINNMANTLITIFPQIGDQVGLAQALCLEDLYSSTVAGTLPISVFNQSVTDLNLGFSTNINDTNYWHNTSVMGLYNFSEYATQSPCSSSASSGQN